LRPCAGQHSCTIVQPRGPWATHARSGRAAARAGRAHRAAQLEDEPVAAGRAVARLRHAVHLVDPAHLHGGARHRHAAAHRLLHEDLPVEREAKAVALGGRSHPHAQQDLVNPARPPARGVSCGALSGAGGGGRAGLGRPSAAGRRSSGTQR
jgi:hypothetical protein